MPSELLDIVNDNDVVVGQLDRKDIYKRNLRCFRTVNGFLINSSSHLWIPVRQSNKELWPLSLDASVAGHVKAGETYEEAFIRETKEELNVDIQNHNFQCLGKFFPKKHKVSSFMKVFLFSWEKEIKYNEQDILHGEYLSWDALSAKLSDGISAKPDLPLLMKLLKMSLS